MEEWLKGLSDMFRSELLALAFTGSLVAQSFWPSTSSRAAIVTVLTGTVVSSITAPAIVTFLEWRWPGFPHSLQGAIHFWAGLMGMHLVPIIAQLLNRLKDAKLPGVDQ